MIQLEKISDHNSIKDFEKKIDKNLSIYNKNLQAI